MPVTLREMRKAKGYTQTEVAQAIGFQSASAYHALEHNQRKYYNPSVLDKLAKTLDVSVTEVMAAMREG